MKKYSLLAVCSLVFGFVICGCNGENKADNTNSVTGADGTVYNSYQTACSKGDFDAARDYVGKMKEQLVMAETKGDYSLRDALQKSIEEAEKYVENEELQYLASINEEQASNRIILILNQRPVDGLEAAENTCLGKKVDHRVIESSINDLAWRAKNQTVTDFKKYIIWCGNHNSKCTSLFNIAIACGNKGLAKKLIHVFRPDPELLTKEIKGSEGYYDVYAHHTNTSKDAAQKKYDEAVAAGVFKE